MRCVFRKEPVKKSEQNNTEEVHHGVVVSSGTKDKLIHIILARCALGSNWMRQSSSGTGRMTYHVC